MMLTAVKRRKDKKIEFVLGMCAVVLSFIPYLLLGTDAIVPYHDQLDGEIIAYILQAKHFGSNVLPEFLNGAAGTALVPPAPFAVFLFMLMPPFTAYICMQFAGQLLAYVGMYLLAGEVTDKEFIAVITALLYAFLPFLPVYGLTQYGLPFLFWCMYNLCRNRRNRSSLFGIALYGLFSSFVLCGYGVLFFWGIWILYELFKEIRKKSSLKVILKSRTGFFAGFVVLTGVYVLENLPLFIQMLTGAGASSHKAEYVIAHGNFRKLFMQNFLSNGEHSTDYHGGILVLWLLLVVIGVLLWRRMPAEVKKRYRQAGICFAGIIVCCLLAALWGSVFVPLRGRMGTLGAFQAERFLWLVPPLWYLLLAQGLSILTAGKKWVPVRAFIGLVYLAVIGFYIVKGSHIKPCLQKLIKPDYPAISWSDYMADGVMEQVEAYIHEKTGLKQSDYRVVSMGIDPSAALYHGFYCLDGYSNNYSLEYKHQFREVIAPELEKSPYLRGYFDTWGNRCYLYSSEIPGYFNIEKGTSWYNRLELNTQALRELGCRYILSAAYIVNSEELNLTLCEELPFTTATSYYNIYLYELVSE